jgi:hypothetical protein
VVCAGAISVWVRMRKELQEVSEQNKAAARVVFEVWTNGDLERLDELVASDVGSP